MTDFGITNLLPPLPPQPAPTRLGCHSVSWWGDPHHPDAGFKSDDPAVVARHMTMMIDAGITYNVINWRGATVNPTQHRAVAAWIKEAESRIISTSDKFTPGGFVIYPFKVAVQVDVGMFPIAVNATNELLNQLEAVKSWFKSPAYLDSLVLEFGTEAVKIDWSLVKAAFPDLKLLFRNKDFLWHTKAATTQASLDILKAQYAQTPRPIMGCAYWQFDDAWPQDRRFQVWPPKQGETRKPATLTSSNFGRTWFDTFAMAYPGLPYLSIVSFDDDEEGTAINKMLAAMQGKRL